MKRPSGLITGLNEFLAPDRLSAPTVTSSARAGAPLPGCRGRLRPMNPHNRNGAIRPNWFCIRLLLRKKRANVSHRKILGFPQRLAQTRCGGLLDRAIEEQEISRKAVDSVCPRGK